MATTTIAIKNQKGGVAKTTTCLSLGACLAEQGYTVLLIDLDPQAHLTLSVGIKPEKLHRTVGDALLASASLVSVSRETGVFDLDIVPANEELALIDKLLYGQNRYEFNLKQSLAAMRDHFYEFILIDCPPSVNTLTLNALTAADLLIVPFQCEYYATHSLQRVLRLLKLVQTKTNPQLTYKLLVTMYDRRNKICQLILERMQQAMQPCLFETIIEIDTKLRESPAFGQPITVYAPDTRAAQQYRSLAQELIANGR
ncbi:MAG: Sporulation initiation inhibitor protein Soj [Anaerolineae bacterium]|nr:Sporulation initiation inhibitor protein Soj [Anaerolineae bacterium]